MKINRDRIHKKYDGHCAYCGKEITIKEMQVDHIIPKAFYYKNDGLVNDFDNLMPSCRRCNHYKRASNLEQFRSNMKTLHERIEQIYINKVGIDFGIIQLTKFDGVFFYEKQD